MKKIILVSSCLLLSLILWMGNSTAKPVDTLTAKTVATHFLAGRNVELPRSVQQARIAYIGHSFDENSQRSVPCYYIVNLNQGFVILSADNRIEPILGYSTEGNFNTEDIPGNMLSFLDGYSAQIKAFLHDTSSTPNEATAKWTSLIRDDYTPNSTKGAVVGPLLTTIWNQNDIYNAYCPTDANGPGGHAYAGCVATAMAQIIRYWEYPTQGTGNHAYTCNSSMYVNGQLTNFNYGTLQVNFGIQYNYSNMPDIITSTNYTDVAKLIYYCGVSVDMEYTPYGSSAYSSDVPNALKQYFKYSNSYGTPTPQYKNRSSYSESNWINLLKSELNNWRPVLYNGSGSGGGHAFVCDGYDDQGYFHFNWGWSGSYNGYFILTALNPGTHIFNDYQGAVINVQGLTPLIKTNSNQLSFLCAAGSVSEAKSLAIHGIALTNNIVITAPADFEISTDGTSYSSSLNVSNTISGIYVRYTPSSSGQATDHGTLTLTSGGTTRTVALSGHTYVLDCNAPQNVQYTADNNGNVQLSWNAPSQDIHSYRFSIDSTFYNSWRLGASNYLLAQRACDSDLVAYHQKRVTQVSFYIPNGVATYSSDRKIVIYQGGSIINNALNEGTLIREQAVSSFVTGWNTVTLNNPVTIDAHQELWYGVQFNSTSSTTFPVPVGTKVGVAGKGDLVKEDGTWTLLSNRGINRNIPIKITIQDSPSSITNYTIEQNDNIVGTVTSTQYNDHVTTSGSYTYNVTANWDNGCSATSNDISVNVITNCTTTYGDTNAVACGSFDWYEHTGIQTSGDYTHTFIGGNAVGCDSVVTMHLTVGHSNTGDTTAFACNSFDWYEHHNITSSTSSLTHTFTNASGCDSTVTLHLTVGHSNTGDTTAFACNSFDWYEHHNITSSTSSLTHTFTNASGCDSTVTLHLTVGHSNTGDTTAFACNSFDWYEHHNITSSTSSLKHTFTNASGCDSVVTLHLTVGHSNTGDTTAFACNSFDWYEHTNITSSTNSLTHTFTNASGCDSVVTLHLTVGHSNTGDTTAFACGSFDWYEHKNITASTSSLTHTFTNANGCDSVVTLHLVINNAVNTDTTAEAVETFVWHRAGAADTTITTSGTYTYTHPDANGCVQTDTLHLTVYHATGTQIDTAACESFVWHRPIAGDTTINDSGTYVDNLTDVHGADSVITLVLNIKHGNFIPFSVAECDSYSWHDSTYTENGTYIFEYVNNVGCPSTDTLHLTINHAVNTDTTAEAVETFVWHRAGAADTTITTSGTYTHAHPDANGCTQTDTLHLTVYHATGTQIDTAACESFVWQRPLAGDTTLLVSGIYYDTLTDVHGADSVITLVLNIKHGNFIPFSVAECDSYSWHDSTYTENGTYIFEYVNNVGCPSTDTLHLTINHAVNTDTTAEAVEAFVWHRAGTADTTITTSGTYTHAHPDANGCTQTDTLHLTVYHASGTQIDTAACESFVWQRPIAGDTTINDSGTYVDNLTDVHGADSVITLVLNIKHGNFIPFSVAECISYMWHDTTYTESGNYLFEYINNVGCPSTDTLHLTINHAVNTDTTAEAVETFVWHRAGAADTTITTSGTYTHAHPDANGCEQTDTLHLTVYHATNTQIDTSACEEFLWHRPLAGDTILTNSGTYIDNLTDVHGADSVVTLVLTIYSAEHTDLHVSICENELPYHYINGQIDTTFDVGTPSLLTVTYTLSTVNGCDSTVSLSITLFEVVNTDTVAEAVEAFIWHRAGAADTTITTSGTYTHTHPDDNGCTQTDTLHLTVYHATNTQIDTSACEEFLWHRPLAGDTTLLASGTYRDTLTDVHGADSVVTLVLTINPSYYIPENIPVMQAQLPYLWHGQTFNESATAFDSLSTVAGCDSVFYLNLTVVPYTFIQDNPIALCQGETQLWRGQQLSEQGTYIDTVPAENTIYTVEVTVNPTYNIQENMSVCESALPFTWHNQTVTGPGIYTDSSQTTFSCDSIHTLSVYVTNVTTQEDSMTVCGEDATYTWHNMTLSETGIYSDTLRNTNGCDSIVYTMNFVKGSPFFSEDSVHLSVVTLPYVWHGMAISDAGVYYDSLQTSVGCDSVYSLQAYYYDLLIVDTPITLCPGDTVFWRMRTITESGTYRDTVFRWGDRFIFSVVVTMGEPFYHNDTVTICQDELPYIWHEQSFDTSGTSILRLQTVAGCDSIYMLTLTVNPSIRQNDTAETCQGTPYAWRGLQLETSGYYVDSVANTSGCEDVYTLLLTVNPTYSVDTSVTITTNDLPYHFVSGQIDTTFEVGTPSQLSVPYTMSTVDGCDSTVTLHLTINVGIENHTAELLRAFPNPTTGHLTVIGSENLTQLQLFDTYGRRVGIYPVEGTQTEIDLHGLASGVYFLKAMREKQTAGTLKIIKNNE